MTVQEYTSSPWAGLGPDVAPVEVVCDHEPQDARICGDCLGLLAGVLADVPALLTDLDLARTKTVSFVERGTRAGDAPAEATTPLPWSEAASKADRRLRDALRAAAAALGLPEGPAALNARRLSGRLPVLARREDGPEWAARISAAVASAHRAIDRPPSPWYYGPCPQCGRDLYTERVVEPARDGGQAKPDGPESEVRCPAEGCGYRASLSAHRLAQLDAGDDRMLTVGELVGAITSAGESVTRDQINSWIRREGLPRERRTLPRLTAAGQLTHTEVYVYRLGDVRRLALEAERRRAETWAGGWE